MKYIDIFRQAYKLKKQPRTSLYFKGLGIRVLAWSANLEHAIFGLEDDVHPATVCVWFQCQRAEVDTIHKIVRIAADSGKMTEVSIGSSPHIPTITRLPHERANAASNTAESVFPQNQLQGASR